jgi:hypothetical protein
MTTNPNFREGVFPAIPPTVVFVDRKLEIHENQSLNIYGFARFIF